MVSPLVLERREDIATIIISNPCKFNAVSAAMRGGVTETFRVVDLRGQGNGTGLQG